MTKQTELTEALEAYIKQARRMDIPDKDIAQKLLDKKYPQELIEQVFKSESETFMPPKLKPVKNLLPKNMKGKTGFTKMEEVPDIKPKEAEIEEYYVPEVEQPKEEEKEVEMPEDKEEKQVQIVEREINLQLINEKLNYIISQLAGKQ